MKYLILFLMCLSLNYTQAQPSENPYTVTVAEAQTFVRDIVDLLDTNPTQAEMTYMYVVEKKMKHFATNFYPPDYTNTDKVMVSKNFVKPFYNMSVCLIWLGDDLVSFSVESESEVLEPYYNVLNFTDNFRAKYNPVFLPTNNDRLMFILSESQN